MSTPKSSKLRFKAVQAELRDRGMSLSRSVHTGEYRVSYKLRIHGGPPGMTAKRQEEIAYYTRSLNDALLTGRAMAETWVSVPG